MERFEAILELEAVLLGLSSNSLNKEYIKARKRIRNILQLFSQITVDHENSIADTITEIKDHGEKEAHRDCAMMLLRIFSVPDVMPKQSNKTNIETNTIAFVEPNLTDFYKRFGIDAKEQTYEKFHKLRQVHIYCCDKLRCLSEIAPNIETISAARNAILRSVGDATVKSYLAAYEFGRVRGTIEAILTQVIEFSKTSDSGFTRKHKELSDMLSDEIEYCRDKSTFLVKDFYLPFLLSVSRAAETVVERSKEQFVCEIRSRKGKRFTLEKRSPLQVENGDIRLIIPLLNSGPGIADRTTVYVGTEDQDTLILTEEIELGGVGPGDFVVPVTFNVCKDLSRLTLSIMVAWRIVGVAIEQITEFVVDVESQAKDIDWDALLSLNPYSLGIATGEGFYGRRDKLNRLIQKLSRQRMQSSYITGQRRVGKSSLAKAVEDRVDMELPECYVLNIECGDFKHPDASKTIESLGDQIEVFLSQQLPATTQWPKANLHGSLSALSQLAGLLEKTEPTKRFLLIIDEFDEINQDLYRHSEIAETFFLNLRSLSGKPNICFILVGAERMSFVMQSQGEKLNRFSRESLDSFHQDDEWQDFESLVKSATEEFITWHDSAIRAVYNYTNGHPYFTKQLCSKIFERAVFVRDAEVLSEEVAIAADELIAELDVNAFQHFWRDGIQGTLDDIEIVSLKRCRVLIGYARAIRLRKPSTAENIEDCMHTNQLPKAEIPALLTDLCRRGVMRERDGVYRIVIPLFDKWLWNRGFNSLIADHLGDELAEKKQALEDAAYVNDKELVSLTSTWPSYRGMQMTHHLIREWISQVPSLIEQRILFKLLANTRFVSEVEIRNGLKELHGRIQRELPIIVTKSKAQRRKDLWITYIDGPGKSGAQFASLYAEENLISTTCVKEMSQVDQAMKKSSAKASDIAAIVIVDDFIGTGRGLSSAIEEFYARNGEQISASNIPVYLLAVCATKKGEDRVRSKLSTLDDGADLIVRESLDRKYYAVEVDNPIWADEKEARQAKALCQNLGIKIDKSRPLGYGGDGLLVVLPRNCPNNTLPIFHSQGRGESQWQPLFERIKH